MFRLSMLAALVVYTDGDLTVKPRSPPESVLTGTSVVLQCGTTNRNVPVVWRCRGRCSVGMPTNDEALIFMSNIFDADLSSRATIVRSRPPGRYDLNFTAVLESDSGIYTCKDDNGAGEEATAELLVVAKPDHVNTGNPRTSSGHDIVIPPQTAQTSQSPTPMLTAQTSETSSVSAGAAMAGIVVGGIAAAVVPVAVIIGIVVICVRRRKHSGTSSAAHQTSAGCCECLDWLLVKANSTDDSRTSAASSKEGAVSTRSSNTPANTVLCPAELDILLQDAPMSPTGESVDNPSWTYPTKSLAAF
jgi:hypothetical protein